MYLENGVKNEVSNTIKQSCQECHPPNEIILLESVWHFYIGNYQLWTQCFMEFRKSP